MVTDFCQFMEQDFDEHEEDHLFIDKRGISLEYSWQRDYLRTFFGKGQRWRHRDQYDRNLA